MKSWGQEDYESRYFFTFGQRLTQTHKQVEYILYKHFNITHGQEQDRAHYTQYNSKQSHRNSMVAEDTMREKIDVTITKEPIN